MLPSRAGGMGGTNIQRVGGTEGDQIIRRKNMGHEATSNVIKTYQKENKNTISNCLISIVFTCKENQIINFYDINFSSLKQSNYICFYFV